MKKVTYYLLSFIILTLIMVHLKIPEERIHLIEYGILGVLVYWAVSSDYSGAVLYALSLTMVLGIGFFDEVIQWILPNRFFGWRDVLINTAGGLIGLEVKAFIFSWNGGLELSSEDEA